MATITVKINEKSKAGKMVKDFLELLAGSPGVEIVNDKKAYNPAFVKKIRNAQKEKGRTMTNAQELWDSIE